MLRVVETECGIVQGLAAADPRITSFRGIPFAKPPVGENRWRAPMPAEKWEGVFKAFDFGPISMQAPTVVNPENIYCREWAVDPDIPMSEDCLWLNVWTPALREDEKLPVYVWFFGGGLQGGHPAEMEFDGERIARRGIVVVTVNYRTNVFGFLCHPEITAENPEAPANFGHLDQQMGLKWVKRNIRAFGGNPDNITIGGQSAGGGSVLTQINSPQNGGLFQRAIIDSGVILAAYPTSHMPVQSIPLAEAEQLGIRFFEFLGVSSLKEARALDAVYIRDKMLQFGSACGTVIDQKFCVDNDYKLWLTGRDSTVPMLLGNTADEFCVAPQVRNWEELKTFAAEQFGAEGEEFLRLCGENAETFEETLKNATVNGIEYTIRLAAQVRAEQGIEDTMYYYRFAPDIPGWDNPGTFHSVDLWFFFETLAKCWRPFVGRHYDLARQMCNYWANFIRSGNPNGKDATGEELPCWKPYSVEEPYGMLFSDTSRFEREQPGRVMRFLVKKGKQRIMESLEI